MSLISWEGWVGLLLGIAQSGGPGSLAIPDPDPIPIPGPVWLLKGLLVLTFLLHLVPMNLVLGGSVFAFLSHLRSRGSRPNAAHHRQLVERLAHVFPVAMALTITTGIAPLLFLQVLYGQLFFSAAILMAWLWLSVLALMLVGYYGFYWQAYGLEVLGPRARWLAGVLAATFLLIAFLFVNNMGMLQNPSLWKRLYLANPHGVHLYVLHDVSLIPRYLHFLLGALALFALLVAGIGIEARRRDQAFGKWAATYGARWFVGVTFLQLFVGTWFLWSQPDRVRGAFLGGTQEDTLLLIVAVAFALGALMALAQPRELATSRFWLGAGCITVTVTLMAIIRQRIRTGWLQPYFRTDTLQESSQWGAVILFSLMLAIGLGITGWMLWQFHRKGPAQHSHRH
ncbi:MAG: hypothetical protein ACE5I9_00785 [Candidatus Methylomirabilales bacterium]